MPRPTLFLLRDAGDSTPSWEGLAAALGDGFDVVVLDEPGSDDPERTAAGLEGAADRVADAVRAREPDEWLIAGRGAGAEVASLVAEWAERGERGLIAAAGLLLVGPAATARSDAPGKARTPTVVLERPDGPDVARALLDLAERARGRAALPPAFARLIASDRVSARTRRAMLARLDGPADAPRALSTPQYALLTALVARVVPQRGTDIDLAGRIDAELAAGHGDGWRFAELPPDAEAWRRGLDTIADAMPDFSSLDAAAQDAVIDRIAAGEIGSDAEPLLTGARMALWFTDVQAEAVRAWLSHPAAQAWIRYDGFADGGDGPRKQGFTTTHAGEWETWQRDWRTGKELQA